MTCLSISGGAGKMKMKATKAELDATKEEVREVVVEINAAVAKHSRGSTLRGLRVVVSGLAALLDMYAQPNAVNPDGMCDDPKLFRKHFADLLVSLPTLSQRRTT